MGTLGRGNRQKVGLCDALMPRADVLILHEPTDGPEALSQETVLELLRAARGESRTVFLSSHVLSEVERVADLAWLNPWTAALTARRCCGRSVCGRCWCPCWWAGAAGRGGRAHMDAP